MMKKINNNLLMMLIMMVSVMMWACEDEESFPRTRLFKPVLNQDLYAEGNTIIVNMGKAREALSYTLEVSRDSFQTVDYTVEVDTNYVEINAGLVGEELFWNTIYQVRAMAHADDPEYDSKRSELGSVRTQRFPSNMNIPASNDVIDVAARVTWVRTGAAITTARVFAVTDLRLENPLGSFEVSAEEEAEGMKIVTGLEPLTTYQIAIYSEEEIRGWTNYTTLAPGVDTSDPNVVDLTESEDPDAVINAIAGAASGNIILVKKGMQYNLPSESLNKSITIQGDLGFGAQQAILYTSGNWNLAEGASIDHIRFIDLELRGADWGGNYIFNPNRSVATTVGELSFDNCYITNVRGIVRIRDMVSISDYIIRNCLVDSIGNYGIITQDSEGDGKGSVGNITLENSTFSHITIGIQTRQNVASIDVDGCTFYSAPEQNRQLFRFRYGSTALSGVSMTNSIFGPGWDMSGGENFAILPLEIDEGISVQFNVVNTYATSEYDEVATNAIAGFPNQTYGGTAFDLWVDPENMDFNFKDTGFSGRTDSGDPRWRTEF